MKEVEAGGVRMKKRVYPPQIVFGSDLIAARINYKITSGLRAYYPPLLCQANKSKGEPADPDYNCELRHFTGQTKGQGCKGPALFPFPYVFDGIHGFIRITASFLSQIARFAKMDMQV